MGLSGRSRIRFNRRRIDVRKYLKWQNFCIISIIICIGVLSFTAISGYILAKKIERSTIVYSKDEKNVEINDNNEVVEVSSNIDSEESTDEKNTTKDVSSDISKDTSLQTQSSKNLSLCLLGEIMMGGTVTQNVNYSYASAFKRVYAKTRMADFTYANFSTNITNLEKIEDAKSDYLVTKNAVSALDALGIDCVSIASDHIVDFPSDIIKNTIGMLEDDKIFVAGRENTPVYFQKDDKRVAIVSTNSVIIGTESLYKKEGISTYQADNLVKNIKEAKEAADVVIVDIHWGREYVYGVTDQMREIAMLAVDNGADLVIGSHALGVYPVVQYNGVPIIYSLGYFIGDSDLYLGKESFIFDISISKENKIEEIDMTPIYINDAKEVLLYEDYNIEKTTEILEQYNTWHLENSLESSIENNKIRIKF